MNWREPCADHGCTKTRRTLTDSEARTKWEPDSDSVLLGLLC